MSYHIGVDCKDCRLLKTGEVFRYILVGRYMSTACVFGLIKLQVWLNVKGMTFISWYKKTALNLTKQNTLRFLWKQVLVEREQSCT